jgi:hypothetical protein
MKILLHFLFMFAFIYSFSQKADNSFHGFYEEKKDETFYKKLEFDGNGKVLIAGLDYGDYFTRNDSIIVYPDKSIFIFKIQKNGNLKGVSEWVDKGIWALKKDSIVENKRTQPEQASKKAILLAEYFDKTKKKSEIDMLFSDETPQINEDLCNKGLAKACLNLFGLKMLQYTPDLLNGSENIPSKKLKPHPELIEISKKIVSLGDPEGHTVLGSYYFVLGLKDKASKEWDKAIKMGSMKAGMTKGLTEFAESIENDSIKHKD